MRPRNRSLRDETQTAPGGAGSAASVPAEPAPSADAPSPAVGASGAPGGGSGGDWRAELPENLRGEKSLANFKTVGALAQGFVETKKMQGAAVVIPGADATPEAVQAFREKLGVPKDASGYAKPEGEGPNGQAIDEARWAQWTSHAHKLGLTPSQLHGLAVLEAEERGQQGAAMRQEMQAGLDLLKAQWGPDGFARKVTLAKRAVEMYGDKELVDMLEATGLGNHPAWVKAWANVGTLLAEDGYIEGRVEGLPTAEELDAKIAALTLNPARKAGGREGERLEAELSALRKLKYGTKDLSAR